MVVVFTDDQGYADIGANGQIKDVRTPHIDARAGAGVRCTAGYITAPQCSPSRAGLITGRCQQRFGFDQVEIGCDPLGFAFSLPWMIPMAITTSWLRMNALSQKNAASVNP